MFGKSILTAIRAPTAVLVVKSHRTATTAAALRGGKTTIVASRRPAARLIRETTPSIVPIMSRPEPVRASALAAAAAMHHPAASAIVSRM